MERLWFKLYFISKHIVNMRIGVKFKKRKEKKEQEKERELGENKTNKMTFLILCTVCHPFF